MRKLISGWNTIGPAMMVMASIFVVLSVSITAVTAEPTVPEETQVEPPTSFALWDTIVAFDDLPVGVPPFPSISFMVTPPEVDLWEAASISCGVIDLDIPINLRVTTSRCILSATNPHILISTLGMPGDTLIFKVLYPFMSGN